MNNPDIVQFLNNNFLVWACSKNLSEGRKVFNALKVRRCPFLGIIALRHSRMTLISKIEGPITAAELIVQLANLVAECEPELVAARHDREQRSQTQMLRLQQDEAYEESLRADREKAKRRQELEDETRRALEQEQRMQDEEEAKKNVSNVFI
jgi:FAS-associated factor 2